MIAVAAAPAAATATVAAGARPAAAAVAAAPAAARAVLTRAGLVDRQGAALELRAAQGGDGLVGAVAHLDEAEAAGADGLPVGGDLGPGDRAELAERLEEVVRGSLERQVPDVDD